MSRWFEPLTDELLNMPFWQPLLTHLGQLFAAVRPVKQWFIEAHQFRIDTLDGVGRPTPEGAHRDGVDFVAVILIGYRSRRHGSFVQNLNPAAGERALEHMPHRAHWQPLTYNALHGGMSRWFEPLTNDLLNMPFWQPLLTHLGQVFAAVRPVKQWFIEAHQFRIDTRDGVGRPTPEGAHRDGVDFVAVILIGRKNIRGGETRVFETEGQHGVRFTLSQPCSVLLMDDTRIIHESTPIMPLDNGGDSWRDTLVLTFRAEGFLEPSKL